MKPCETVQGKADDNMSITRSISVAQTDNRVAGKRELLCPLLLLLKPCESVQGTATMIMPRYLSAIRSERDTRKKYVRRERGTRIEEDNTVYYSFYKHRVN